MLDVFLKDSVSGILNTVSGQNTDRDNIQSARPYVDDKTYNKKQEYLDYFRASWQCKKVIAYHAIEATSLFGEFVLPDKLDLAGELNQFIEPLKNVYLSAQIRANLQGRAYVIKMVDDGNEWDIPIDYKKVRSVQWSKTLDCDELYYFDSTQEPEYYHYLLSSCNSVFDNLKDAIARNQTSKIHKSRIAVFRGNLIPSNTSNNYLYEDSLLVAFLNPYLRYYQAIASAGAALTDFERVVHKWKGLSQLIKGATEGNKLWDNIKKYFEGQQKAQGILRTNIIDSEDDIAIINRRFTGVTDIIEVLRDEMIAASGLSSYQFFKKREQNALSTASETDRLEDAKNIKVWQVNKWNELIEEDCRLVLALHKQLDIDYEWSWLDTFYHTPSEIIDQKDKNSVRDERYVNMGVYNAMEIRESRFRGEQYGNEITLNDNLFNKEKKDDKQDIEEDKQEIQEVPITDTIEKYIPENVELISESYYDPNNLEEVNEDE